MAIESESQGQIQEFVEILKRRRFQILIPALLVFTLGCAVAVLFPRKYEVSTTIEIKPMRIEEDYQYRNTSETAAQAEIVNASHHIKHFQRIRSVLDEEPSEMWAGLVDDVARMEYIHAIRDGLNVNVAEKPKNQGSDFVDIQFEDVEGEWAARFLNRLAGEWVQQVIERDRTILEQEKEVFQNAKEDAWEKYRADWMELTQLIQENNLQKNEFEGGTYFRDEDPFLVRLEEDEETRRDLMMELAEIRAQQEATEALYNQEPNRIPHSYEDVGVDFESQIAKFELQIQTMRSEQERLRPANSIYQRLEEQIQQVYEQIEQAQSLESGDSIATAYVENPRKRDLKTRVDGFDVRITQIGARIEALNDDIAERRAIYQERLDNISRASMLRETAAEWLDEFNKSSDAYHEKVRALQVLEAGGEAYDIVEAAVAPDSPSKPNPALIVVFGLVLGLGVGLGSAVLSEYTKSGYRGVGDVTRVMTVPVLGAIGTIWTRAEVRRRRMRRLLVGVSSLILIGGVAVLTYGYHQRAPWLSPDLVNTLDDFRLMLR